MMLPLATGTWDEKEFAALQRVIQSDRFTMGPEVAEFEKRFAEYTGSRYCVMVNSGSSANLIAFAALFHSKKRNYQRGDEVIVPAVSWSTTYYPIHQYGLKMRFVDIDSETLNLDIDKVEQAINERTRAIFAVNLLGNPIDYGKLCAIAEKHGLDLIEDNCESMGATLSDKQSGTFGCMGTFSSFFSHHISTMEGGMVVTDDVELYQLMYSMRAHGWTRGLPEDNVLTELSSDPFMESFRFILPGYNLRPLEMSGALGVEQLNKLPRLVEGRRKNATYFCERFSKIKGIRIQREVGESSWFGFAIICPADKRGVILSTLEENGVETRPIVAGNFTRNPVIELLDHVVESDLANANDIHENGFFIGNHHYDIIEPLSKVADLIEGLVADVE